MLGGKTIFDGIEGPIEIGV